LEIAEEFAGQTHYDVLHRVHLLYGLLRVPEGTFGGAIRSVGISSEALAELLYVELPRGNATTQHDRPLRISSLSAELLEILCNAEVLAGAEQGSDQINTEHLAKAWGRSGGGLGGSFLVRNGVKVTKLFE
jgi:ATP-dependent Clp protease ATP-binding subunit ClpA